MKKKKLNEWELFNNFDITYMSYIIFNLHLESGFHFFIKSQNFSIESGFHFFIKSQWHILAIWWSNFNSLSIVMPSNLGWFFSQTWVFPTFSHKCSKRWPAIRNLHFSAFIYIQFWLNHFIANWVLFSSFSIATFKEL